MPTNITYDVFSPQIGLDPWLQKSSTSLSTTQVASLPDVAIITGSSGSPIQSPISAPVNLANVLSGSEVGSILAHGKRTFTDTTAGFMMGQDSDGVYKWTIGDGTSGIDWAVTAASTLTVMGTITASEIHIPDTTTANSWHVSTAGLMWSGANVANVATAPVRINPTGEMTLGDSTGVHLQLSGPNVRIRSSNYVTGVNGSGFTLDGNLLEVGNISARGILRSAIFQTDVVSVVGGNLLVTPGDKLDTDMTALDASTLTIEGNETFAVGDILRIQDGSGATDVEWLEVTNIGSAPTYTVTRDLAGAYGADANPAWTAGAAVVNYQQSGDGLIYMTASDTNAPYIQIITHAGAPYTTVTERVRLGNLTGISDVELNPSGYGIYTTNGFFSGSITVGSMAILPTSGLVAAWLFNEESGSTAIDSVGSLNGTITGAVYVTGISGTALDFDGVNDLVTITDAAPIQNIFDGGGSLSVWINPDSDGEGSVGRVVNKDNVTNGWMLLTQDESGSNVRLRFVQRFSVNPGAWNTAVNIPLNTWTHVVVVYNSDSASNDPTIYINGSSVTVTEDSIPSGTRQTDVGQDLIIGNDATTAFTFDGTIDEIRVFSSSLSYNHVKALYLNPNGISGTITSPIFQTATAGQRVVINSLGVFGYDGVNSSALLSINTSNSNIFTINKQDNTLAADCIRITDSSTDTQATMTVNSAGAAATKDGLLWQRTTGTTMRYLTHFEMVTPGAGTNTVTNLMRFTQPATCAVTDGIIYSMTGGTVTTAVLNLIATGGTPNLLVRARNETDAGGAALFQNTSTSNTSETVRIFNARAASYPLDINQTGATSTNFYLMINLNGNGNAPQIYVANNASPDTALTAPQGSMCLSTNGNIYRNTDGSTAWTAM